MHKSNTKDFINYCNAHGIPKKYAEKTFKLFSEFAISHIASKGKFVIHGFGTFKIMKFNSNLKGGKLFNKIKFIVARKVKVLINNK